MPSSSAPTAKAALLALLQARPNLNGISVTWAYPTNVPEEFIFFGNTVFSETAAQLGNGMRHENYDIEVYVIVHQSGLDAQACEERVYALLDEVKAAVSPQYGATDLGIVNGSSILSMVAEFASGTIQTFQENDGYTVQAAPAAIAVSARIR